MPTIRGVAKRCDAVARAGWRAEARRVARRRLSKSLPTAAKVHLGCGPVRLPGWVNVDIDRRLRPDLRMDLRAGFPAPPQSVAFFFSEHVLEHFSLEDGERLLRDCREALERGGVLRLAMPDLRNLVDKYLGDWKAQDWLREPAYRAIDSPARMLNFGVREWGHLYLYDLDELTLRLQQAGFNEVRACPPGSSRHPELSGLERRPDSFLIVEATR